MGLGLTVKPFFVYVLMLKMNQSASQNIGTLILPYKFCGGPGHVPAMPPPKSGPGGGGKIGPTRKIHSISLPVVPINLGGFIF